MIADPAVEGERFGDGGQGVLAALLAGFEGVAPPLVRLAIAGLDDGVAGDERLDGGDPELDGFLDDEVHVFALGDRLRQGDGGQGRARRQNFSEGQWHTIARDTQNLRHRAAALAVEDRDRLAGLGAENLGKMARFIARQSDV